MIMVSGANDFRFKKFIGEGGFGTVYLAEDIHTNEKCAIKVCKKKRKNQDVQRECIKRESEVMQELSNVPGFVSLFCTFQDKTNYYLAMTYAENGDMLRYISKMGSFDQKCCQYYAAELVLSLENMHRIGVVHRDLKPGNILFDKNFHTLIADFNASKIMTEANDKCLDIHRKQYSFVGTAEYVSPEMITGQSSSKSVDLWALGCIIYYMISGLLPFSAATKHLIFEKILKLDLIFPEGFDKNARDLTEKLLQIDPNKRLGMADVSNCYQSVREHPFFNSIEWNGLRQQTPPNICDEEHLNKYRVSVDLESSFNDQELTTLELGTEIPMQTKDQCEDPLKIPKYSRQCRLTEQRMDEWRQYLDGEVIIKKGFVKKRKWWFFAKKQMLILTSGPKLIYVDPVRMERSEIPWSADLKTKVKNLRRFLIVTLNRTYCFEDPQGLALEWCNTIDYLRQQTYGDQN